MSSNHPGAVRVTAVAALGVALLYVLSVPVVDLAAQGLTDPQIGERLLVSRGTVKVHLSHAYAKLDVHNRAELAALASRRDRGDAGGADVRMNVR